MNKNGVIVGGIAATQEEWNGGYRKIKSICGRSSDFASSHGAVVDRFPVTAWRHVLLFSTHYAARVFAVASIVVEILVEKFPHFYI